MSDTLTPDANYELLKDYITTGVVVTFQGKLYRVEKVNPANYRVVDEAGGRFNLRRAGSVKRAPRQDAWRGDEPVDAWRSDFKLGSPTRLKSATHRQKYGNHVWIIVAISSDNTFRLAKLGGTPNNAYLRGFAASDLELIKGSFQEEN